MKLAKLIESLQAELAANGDIDVVLHVENDDDDMLGRVVKVACEDDHGTGELFIRISGDQSEPPAGG